MIVILVVGGLIMMMLGVIGEYVWRINEEVRKRPNYIVRERFESNTSTKMMHRTNALVRRHRDERRSIGASN